MQSQRKPSANFELQRAMNLQLFNVTFGKYRKSAPECSSIPQRFEDFQSRGGNSRMGGNERSQMSHEMKKE